MNCSACEIGRLILLMYGIDIYGLQQISQCGFHVLRSLQKQIYTQHLYDYISTRHHEQLTTNLNIQHDLFVELETFYDHVDQSSVKRAMVMFTINRSKTTYLVYFI